MKPPKPYPSRFLSSAADFARRYATDYAASAPEFKGWLPGIGWSRLAGWLARQRETFQFPAVDPDPDGTTDLTLADRFSLKDLTDHVAANCPDLLAADRARFHSAFPPRPPRGPAVIDR